MSILEQRITKNKELFDVNEPEDGHFDRFQDRLKEIHKPEKSIQKRWYFSGLQVAASVLILLAVTFVLFLYNNGSISLFAPEISPELAEVTNYYTSITQEKLAKIEELSQSDEEAKKLKQTALMNVDAIGEQTQVLEKEYIDSNKDTRVFGAIVNNYRLLASALDKVIENMNDVQQKKIGAL